MKPAEHNQRDGKYKRDYKSYERDHRTTAFGCENSEDRPPCSHDEDDTPQCSV